MGARLQALRVPIPPRVRTFRCVLYSNDNVTGKENAETENKRRNFGGGGGPRSFHVGYLVEKDKLGQSFFFFRVLPHSLPLSFQKRIVFFDLSITDAT